MIVTARAAVSHPHKYRSHGVGDVVEDFLPPHNWICKIALVGPETIESGGDSGGRIVGIQLVARDLLFDESIVRLVLIEGLNDVIAITPDVRPGLIGFEPCAIGITRKIQPVAAPPLAVL